MYNSWARDGELRIKMQVYIKNHDDASQIKSLKSELDNLMSRIMSEFTNSSNNKFDVLTSSGVYRSQFEKDIADRYETITRPDQQDFEYRKQILENILRDGTNGQGRPRQTLSAQNLQNLDKVSAHNLLSGSLRIKVVSKMSLRILSR